MSGHLFENLIILKENFLLVGAFDIVIGLIISYNYIEVQKREPL